LKAVQAELQKIRAQQATAASAAGVSETFATRQQIAEQMYEAVLELSRTSFEFAAFLRQLIPQFTIHPVQALDSGQVHPRAKLTVCLPVTDGDQSTRSSATVQLDVDVFDEPVHIKHLEQVRQAKREVPRRSYKQIANQLGINHMTVKRASDYLRLMDAEGSAVPYRELTEKPAYASRWKPRGQRQP